MYIHIKNYQIIGDGVPAQGRAVWLCPSFRVASHPSLLVMTGFLLRREFPGQTPDRVDHPYLQKSLVAQGRSLRLLECWGLHLSLDDLGPVIFPVP